MYDFNIYAKHAQLTIELCINMASAYWNVRGNQNVHTVGARHIIKKFLTRQ